MTLTGRLGARGARPGLFVLGGHREAPAPPVVIPPVGGGRGWAWAWARARLRQAEWERERREEEEIVLALLALL